MTHQRKSRLLVVSAPSRWVSSPGGGRSRGTPDLQSRRHAATHHAPPAVGPGRASGEIFAHRLPDDDVDDGRFRPPGDKHHPLAVCGRWRMVTMPQAAPAVPLGRSISVAWVCRRRVVSVPQQLHRVRSQAQPQRGIVQHHFLAGDAVQCQRRLMHGNAPSKAGAERKAVASHTCWRRWPLSDNRHRRWPACANRLRSRRSAGQVFGADKGARARARQRCVQPPPGATR